MFCRLLTSLVLVCFALAPLAGCGDAAVRPALKDAPPAGAPKPVRVMAPFGGAMTRTGFGAPAGGASLRAGLTAASPQPASGARAKQTSTSEVRRRQNIATPPLGVQGTLTVAPSW